MRRKASWGEYTFLGESPIVAEKEVEMNPVIEITEKIRDIENKFYKGEYGEQKLIMEFNKIYITNFLSGKYDSRQVELEPENKLKLFCAYHIISGEPSKRKRRQSILMNLVNQ
jgi:hypothetical protein